MLQDNFPFTPLLQSVQANTRLATPFFWFSSSSLGTAKSKLQLRDTGSWSFHVCIPKLELGNEYKTHKNYTTAIGYELWLIGGEQKIDPSTWQPTLSSYLQAGHPVIVWNKGKASAVEIWVDRTNANNFVLFSVNTKPNVTDLTPLPAGGSGALWKYKAIYHLDDQPVGLWSNIISVTVGV